MWTRFLVAPAAAATILASSPDVLMLDLKPKTLAAFERYVKATEARIATERSGQNPFLWVNRQQAAAKNDAMARLMRGEVIPARLETLENGKKIAVEDGMIHHWIGSVLFPGVSLVKARAVVEKYDQYPRVLGPMVLRAKVIEHDGTDYVVQMRTSVTKLGFTVVMDADYRVAYNAVSQSKLFTRSVATNVFEVKSPGEKGETKIEGDKSSGFMWRLNTYCSFEELPQGTVEQCESVSLTRGMPWLASLIGLSGLVNSLPRDTLEFTLSKVREEAINSVKSSKGPVINSAR